MHKIAFVCVPLWSNISNRNSNDDDDDSDVKFTVYKKTYKH